MRIAICTEVSEGHTVLSFGWKLAKLGMWPVLLSLS
jgi:hypothetical protein